MTSLPFQNLGIQMLPHRGWEWRDTINTIAIQCWYHRGEWYIADITIRFISPIPSSSLPLPVDDGDVCKLHPLVGQSCEWVIVIPGGFHSSFCSKGILNDYLVLLFPDPIHLAKFCLSISPCQSEQKLPYY